jgi:hypothetical protein
MPKEITTKQLRHFGLTLGSIFLLIGLWPAVVRGAGMRGWALALAAGLLIPAVLAPASLLWLYKGWMALGDVLGRINTGIILGLVFYTIVTPIGLIRRGLGKDPMGRKLRPDLDSYRVTRKPRPGSHLTRQY